MSQFNKVSLVLPVLVTGESRIGLPSLSALQAGDKVRFFKETGKDGKPKMAGRPQLRATTYGCLDDQQPTWIEITGLIDDATWDRLEDKFQVGKPLSLKITGYLQMNGDAPDRVKLGAKSMVGGALICNIASLEIDDADAAASNFKRTKPQVLAAAHVETSLD